ncbi:ATPase [Microbulbifer flavimaris]|uniref:ATPase n=1 Tax=Microbulbifer flavimaris TaxID=1781068 RepID=A0ABX4HVZ2_9GAMM|nr:MULTISPECIES: hypothetical protein [Microbulbifer]KUJ80218.1 hypothetical protein AVO43_14455 [Microbulbifer sp. ZGT114]PCO04284.1 ATPase [Microbulbifer flavimaris]
MGFSQGCRALATAGALALTSPGEGYAEVIQQADSSFTIRFEESVAADNAAVYRALGQLPEWWSADHTYSGAAENLSMELRAGGCFCERWEDSSVEHLRVIFAREDREVRLAGGLGPLQSLPVNGLMHWRITPAESGAVLTWEYQVWGAPGLNLAPLAGPVEQVLGQQLQGLKAFLDKQ